MKWVDLGMDTQALRLGKGLLIRGSKPGTNAFGMIYVSDADSEIDGAVWEQLKYDLPAESALRKPRRVEGVGKWQGGSGGALPDWEGDN